MLPSASDVMDEAKRSRYRNALIGAKSDPSEEEGEGEERVKNAK